MEQEDNTTSLVDGKENVISVEPMESPNSGGQLTDNSAEAVSDKSSEALSKAAETSGASKPARSENLAEVGKPMESETTAGLNKPANVNAEASGSPKEEIPLTVSNIPLSSKKKTLKSLKAKSKVLKKPGSSSELKTSNEPKSIHKTGKVIKRKRKRMAANKTVLRVNKTDNNEDVDNQILNGKVQSDQAEENREKVNESETSQDKHEEGEQDGTENENREVVDKKQAEKSLNNEKTSESGNKQSNLEKDGKIGVLDSVGVQKESGFKRKKVSLIQKGKKNKFDGLIFMCNKKTKPDCFRYQVMGVSMGKKDTVLGIKRGMKLFLYDFDRKLLHGIYKATSCGDVSLEPRAFGGAFPAQVRFEVHKDCVPLPEAVFKKAIKENYNDKNKFKTELTFLQVKRLMSLFKPAGAGTSNGNLSSPATTKTNAEKAKAKAKEKAQEKGTSAHNKEAVILDKGKSVQDKEAPVTTSKGTNKKRKSEGESNHRSTKKKEEPRSRREDKPRNSLRKGEPRSRRSPPHIRAAAAVREPRRRDASPRRNLYLTEKEYRTYGLRGERRELTPPRPHFLPPPVDTHQRDYERDRLLRHQDLPREPGRVEPLYPSDRDYHRGFNLGERRDVETLAPRASDPYASDPYYSRYFGGSATADPYLPPPMRENNYLGDSSSYSNRGRREEYLHETDPLRRREREREEIDSLRHREEIDSLRRREENDLLRRREETDSLRRRNEDDMLRRRDINQLDRLYSTYGSDGYLGYHSSSRYLEGRSYLSR